MTYTLVRKKGKKKIVYSFNRESSVLDVHLTSLMKEAKVAEKDLSGKIRNFEEILSKGLVELLSFMGYVPNFLREKDFEVMNEKYAILLNRFFHRGQDVSFYRGVYDKLIKPLVDGESDDYCDSPAHPSASFNFCDREDPEKERKIRNRIDILNRRKRENGEGSPHVDPEATNAYSQLPLNNVNESLFFGR